MDPELRLNEKGWTAERNGVRVTAACGQEALLRLGIELWAHGTPSGERLIAEEVQAPQMLPVQRPLK
jgi:hypothetical protein